MVQFIYNRLASKNKMLFLVEKHNGLTHMGLSLQKIEMHSCFFTEHLCKVLLIFEKGFVEAEQDSSFKERNHNSENVCLDFAHLLVGFIHSYTVLCKRTVR